MNWQVWGWSGARSAKWAVVVFAWVSCGIPALANDHYGDGAGKIGGPVGHLAKITPHGFGPRGEGTLGYGPPGIHPGFQGFGLGYHAGHGYGGWGLGVGAFGGYPCYGGPGYPSQYGYPCFAYPFYEGIGALVPDQPVVVSDLPNAREYGAYTGASNYAFVHPSYAAEAASTGSIYPGRSSMPDTAATRPAPEATYSTPSGEPSRNLENLSNQRSQRLHFGMEIEAVAANTGRKGMKVVSVLPGSTAETAGLRVGDMIYSINGYLTLQGGNVDWIVENAAPDKVLKIVVRKPSDNEDRTLTIQLP